MKKFDQVSEGILRSAGRGLGKLAKGTWQNVIAPAAVAAGQEIASTLGKEISKAASGAIKNKFNPTQITPQGVPGAAAGAGSNTSSGSIAAPIAAPGASSRSPGATSTAASGSMTAPIVPVVSPGSSAASPVAPGASGKSSSAPGAMKASTPKKPGVGVMVDPSTGATTTSTAAGVTPGTTAPVGASTSPAAATTASTPTSPSGATLTPGQLSSQQRQQLIIPQLIQRSQQLQSQIKKLKDASRNTSYDGLKRLQFAQGAERLENDSLELTSYINKLKKEDFNQFNNVDEFSKLLQEEKYDDCLFILNEWLPLLAAVGRTAALAGASGAAGTVASRASSRAFDKYEARKAQQQQAQPTDLEDEEQEDCECEAGKDTQISLKGKIDQLKKAINILKSIGLLENKYIMNDMADSTTTVKEGAISRALGGAAIGSLIPGVGTAVGAGLGLGAGQVVGSLRKGIVGPKPGEDAESKKKKLKFNVKKADRNKNGKIEGWEKGLAHKFTSKESTNISNFIKYISQKNYAEANKYLQEVVNSKLQARIKQALKQKLF